MQVEVEVTQEDIEHGTYRDCLECPVARAIKRAVPDCLWVSVGCLQGSANQSDRTAWFFVLPRQVASFIRAFDEGAQVEPFTFSLNLRTSECVPVFVIEGRVEDMGQLNIELFKKIREKIATTPSAYDQETYGRVAYDAPCGTAACIAGWACVLGGAEDLTTLQSLNAEYRAGNEAVAKRIPITARSLLGLKKREADVLFVGDPSGYNEEIDDYEGGWPEPFGGEWESATDEERAAVAVAYLTHIIDTGKVLE